MGLVTGFSGIISPPNLATNGAFRIHQRNPSSNGTLYPVKSGDYVADCWKISSSTTVDYVECGHHQDGHILFRGYGKKGQKIDIENVDTTLFGNYINDYSDSNIDLYMTSSARVRNMSGVPISSTSYPKRDSGTGLTTGTTYIEAKTTRSLKPTVRHTKGRNFLTPLIVNSLNQDGEFDFVIYDFMELAGAFRDLPKYAPVHYADDLVRCQRYYYKSSAVRPLGRPVKVDTDVVRYSEIHQFPITMVANPSVTVESAGTTGDHVAYTGSGGGSSYTVLPNGSGAAGNITSSQTRIYIEYSGLTSTQTNHAVDNGVASYYNITAEVV